MDDQRIRSEIAARGGKVRSIKYSLWGLGWWGERNDSIYQVEYLDREGNLHHTYIKTHAGGGVYFGQDQITRPSDSLKQEKPLTTQALKTKHQSASTRNEADRKKRKKK